MRGFATDQSSRFFEPSIMLFITESRESTPAPPQPSPQSPPCSPPFLLSPAISPPGSRNSTQCHGHAKKDQTSTNLAIGPLLLGLAMTSHHGDHRQTGRDLNQAHLSPFRTELISRWPMIYMCSCVVKCGHSVRIKVKGECILVQPIVALIIVGRLYQDLPNQNLLFGLVSRPQLTSLK